MNEVKKNSTTKQATLFTMGVKPTIFLGVSQEPAIELKANYPHIHVKNEYAENLLFFQSEDKKKEFIQTNGLTGHTVQLDDKLIGEILGFPPMAVEAFPVDEKERTIIDYHAIQFVCRKKDADACLEYMHETYPIPKELQMELDTDVKVMYRIQRGEWEITIIK